MLEAGTGDFWPIFRNAFSHCVGDETWNVCSGWFPKIPHWILSWWLFVLTRVWTVTWPSLSSCSPVTWPRFIDWWDPNSIMHSPPFIYVSLSHLYLAVPVIYITETLLTRVKVTFYLILYLPFFLQKKQMFTVPAAVGCRVFCWYKNTCISF